MRIRWGRTIICILVCILSIYSFSLYITSYIRDIYLTGANVRTMSLTLSWALTNVAIFFIFFKRLIRG